MYEKNIDYLTIICITFLIFIVIFISKKIYPFGHNTLIYSDMYDQLTSYYYYLYDCIKGSSSIFINFSASSGINFFGIICYYLFSPFTFLILLSTRNKIYLFVSIIVVLKIVLCNITALYMLKKLFKNLNNYLCVFLALFYGFSIYSLNYYLISSWIDAMYMFPLIVVGLKKLFDANKPIMYIIALTLSLYFSFYITLMALIFIFVISIFYLKTYISKKDFAKQILSLGISTALSIGCSLFIIIPTYKQISISSRMNYGIESLINSKLGPIIDKTSLFLFGSILFVGIFLLLKNYKKHKKFLAMYIPSMVALLIPYIVEPVNKLLHFGSYASFPYRFGFITVIFMIIGAAYYFSNYEKKENKTTVSNKVISIILTIVATLVTLLITLYKYSSFQTAISNLTLSSHKLLIILLIVIFIICFIANLIIFIINKGFNKLSFILIFIISIVHIFGTTYIYVGIEDVQPKIKDVYGTLNNIAKDNNNNLYRYKNNTNYIINNSSNVTKMSTLDHFSSLTDGNNQKTLKKLGFSSYWTITYSSGGTLFSDILLGNKYIFNKGEDVYNYSLNKQYDNLSLYQYNDDISFGYLVNNNIKIDNYNNTFDLQNAIYKSISSDNENLFETIDNYTTHNIKITDDEYIINNIDNYIEFKVNVEGKKALYLELYKSIDNKENEKIFNLFDIYVNNKLIMGNYPNKDTNGVLNLGVYEKEEVVVKIILKDNCSLSVMKIGMLNLNKLDNFVKDNYLDYKIEFNNNKINININSKENKILFLPINYNESYSIINNGKKAEIIKLYDNYIGINLEKGDNEITLEFIPQYLKSSFSLSLSFIILTILLIKTNLYQNIINMKLFQKIAKFIYLGMYAVLILFIYLLPSLAFLISFINHITI